MSFRPDASRDGGEMKGGGGGQGGKGDELGADQTIETPSFRSFVQGPIQGSDEGSTRLLTTDRRRCGRQGMESVRECELLKKGNTDELGGEEARPLPFLLTSNSFLFVL